MSFPTLSSADRDALLNLQAYLNEEFTGAVIVPTMRAVGKVAAGKQPDYHGLKLAEWKEAHFRQYIDDCAHGAVILLTRSLVVFDIDAHDWADAFEQQFPELRETVTCETAKGRHYYFRRTAACDINDGARPVNSFRHDDDTGEIIRGPDGRPETYSLPFDFKSTASNGTPGCISIPPSPGKRWLRELGKHAILPFPDDLLAHIESKRKEFDETKAMLAREAKSAVAHRPFDPAALTMNDHWRASTLETVGRLLKITADGRWDEYKKTLDIGFTMFHLDPAPDGPAFALWRDNCRRSQKFEEGWCEDKWRSMKDVNDPLTIGTLHHWAKEDDPVAYGDAMHQDLMHRFQRCKCIPQDVAELVAPMMRESFTYCDKSWYFFDGVVHRRLGGNNRVLAFLGGVVRSMFAEAFASSKRIDAANARALENAMNACEEDAPPEVRVYNSLGTPRFKENVISELCYMLEDPEFASKLERRTDLIAFSDGVYELKTRTFRPGARGDFLTMSVGYPFVPDVDHERRAIVDDFWAKVHPDPAQRDYVLNMFARNLQGQSRNLVHFHAGKSGSAGNGKSTSLEILMASLGGPDSGYMRKIDVAVFTAKRTAASSASPHLEAFRHRRILFCSEPNADERINTGIFKELSGGEHISARMLYHGQESIRANAALHLCCNDPPQIDGSDEGLKRRIRTIPYVSRFLPAGDAQIDPSQHIYAGVDGFKECVADDPALKMEFLRVLFERFDPDLDQPPTPSMLECTRSYFESNVAEADVLIGEFVEQCVVADKDAWFTWEQAESAALAACHGLPSKFPKGEPTLKQRFAKALDKALGKKEAVNYVTVPSGEKKKLRCFKGCRLNPSGMERWDALEDVA